MRRNKARQTLDVVIDYLGVKTMKKQPHNICYAFNSVCMLFITHHFI